MIIIIRLGFPYTLSRQRARIAYRDGPIVSPRIKSASASLVILAIENSFVQTVLRLYFNLYYYELLLTTPPPTPPNLACLSTQLLSLLIAKQVTSTHKTGFFPTVKWWERNISKWKQASWPRQIIYTIIAFHYFRITHSRETQCKTSDKQNTPKCVSRLTV